MPLKVPTMTSVWLVAVCFLISLEDHVSANTLCTYRITETGPFARIYPYTENRYCTYGCCEHDCCSYQEYKSANKDFGKIVGIVVGVVVVVSLIVSVVAYFYRRHRLRKRVIQYGRFGDLGNSITVTISNHI